VPFSSHSRGLKLIFLANIVSMIGSGMNSAAVIWFILQATHSEVSLGLLMMLQSLPALFMLPMSGVIIDRNDRRFLVMALDASRLVIIAIVAALALQHRAQVWQVYAMFILVAAGFWMFWPTMNALIQELSPADRFVHSNTFIMAGVQGGFLIAGALVGFIYNHIGLGGVLVIDALTYVFSFSCYIFVRRGKHIVAHHQPSVVHATTESELARFVRETKEGFQYVREHPAFLAIGLCWSLFLSAMMSQGVVTAPLSDRILHAGAVGFGWLNAGWGIGAFLSATVAIQWMRRHGAQRVTRWAMAALAIGMFAAPFSRWLAIAVIIWFFAGCGRGIGGIALNSEFMEQIPKHLMGRVQNIFYFLGTALQVAISLLLGGVAHSIGLELAFFAVALIYAAAFCTTLVRQPQPEQEEIAAASSL
jgi:DHA3 family macrolide efflux protein-like MFS transporter